MSLKIHTDTTDSSDLVSRKNGATTWALGLLLLVGVLFAGGRTVRASLPVISIGEVNANDVYVRSGDSTNHYTVCKLMAGERVRVVSESGNWFEILPPPCAFSLVSGDYVTIDEQRPNVGVINGDNVRIRTGSAINNNKYTIQTKLSRGAEVQVIGQ
ncbi:MAG: SH3 domain-containing protein, partial [Phycisphaerae bacterium]